MAAVSAVASASALDMSMPPDLVAVSAPVALGALAPISEGEQKEKDLNRSPESLKIAHGVYSDKPDFDGHLTAEQQESQRKAVKVLGNSVAVYVPSIDRVVFPADLPNWLPD